MFKYICIFIRWCFTILTEIIFICSSAYVPDWRRTFEPDLRGVELHPEQWVRQGNPSLILKVCGGVGPPVVGCVGQSVLILVCVSAVAHFKIDV